MLPRYSAFLPRFWRRDGGSQRIEIEHIQAGTRGVVATPAAALAWLARPYPATRRAGDRTRSRA